MASARFLGERFGLALVVVLLMSAPASAGGRWDPADAKGPLDIRWIGAYRVSGDLHKVTVVFWNRVSDADLDERFRLSFVDEDPYGAGSDGYRLEGKPGRLRLSGRESPCRYTEGGPLMIRVSPTTIRFYLVGWQSDGPIRYRATTAADPCGGRSIIDRAGPVSLT